jgi:hypothetical protein
MPGLADAADDHAPALSVEALLDQAQRREKAGVEALDQRAHRVGFDREHEARELQRAVAGARRALSLRAHCAYHSREV